jgi:hypothetical protein
MSKIIGIEKAPASLFIHVQVFDTKAVRSEPINLFQADYRIGGSNKQLVFTIVQFYLIPNGGYPRNACFLSRYWSKQSALTSPPLRGMKKLSIFD